MPDGVSDSGCPTLFVCTTCKRAGSAPAANGGEPEGKALHDALAALLAERDGESPVKLVPIVCLANCDRGCTVAIGSEGKWSYILGFLGREHASDILDYAAAYTRSANGAVLRADRSESLRQAIVARYPTHLEPLKEAAE